jgi:membrane-associated protease RseP (regulator of RpoE activity)
MAKFLLSLLPLLFATSAPEGWLGVYLDPERDEPVVAEVIPDSPAAKAGLQLGDVIVRIGADAAPSRERVRAVLVAAQPGDRFEVLVRRGGAEQRVFVRLGERPAAAAPKASASGAKPSRPAGPAGEVAAAPAAGAPASAAPDAPKSVGEGQPATGGATPSRATAGGALASAPASGPQANPAAVGSPGHATTAAPPSPARDVDAEITALRAELTELRRQLDELRRALRRE